MVRTAQTFGVSFSIKQCRKFGIDPHKTLDWLIDEAGFKRFRLMSYWNEHEKQPGKYDFKELDWQLDRITKAGGQVTLCVGARQPRWPENHWPEWAWDAPKAERSTALLRYIEKVVTRYRGHPALISYQLENEALLRSFGERAEVDIDRLIDEFELIKRLDPDHPLIMTTSHHWGIPWNDPMPDIVGFSYYHVVHDQGRYKSAHHYAWLHRARHYLIRLLKRRPVFIHELQLEPWGPHDIWEMAPTEQDRSMGPAQIATNVRLAKKTRIQPIDLWGGEWWYWRLTKHNDPGTWEAVKQAINL
ncbi:MAG TPA: beta-galactosidase [Candidatus Saccharimonadales bacterium]|nr:beta-galactosidase [Candidatus Saccharimonadales bacterium]